MTIGLEHFLTVSALVFSIGLAIALSKRNAIGVLMGVELMLNGVNLNLIAFWRFIAPDSSAGLVFAAFVFIVAAAEAAVGLALIISVYRNMNSVDPEKLDQMKL